MQPFTQKYCVVALLEDKPEGYQFSSSDWPLHATILGTFAVDWAGDELAAKLVECSNGFKPTTTLARQDTHFGPEHNVHVVILDTNDGLVALHQAVLDCLKPGKLVLNEPQYADAGFRAHATVQKHARVNIGDTVTITNLALVDMFPENDPYQRKIRKIIQLKQ